MNLKEYFAVVGSRFTDDDAKVIGPELERLPSRRAEDILDAARPDASPLHPYFEWDDSLAAEMYRKDQARHMAASVTFKVVTVPAAVEEHREVRLRAVQSPSAEPVRLFHAVREMTVNRDGAQVPKPGPKVYKTVQEIQQNPYLAAQVIADAKASLIGWAKRYKEYQIAFKEFGDTFQPIFDFVEHLEQVAAAAGDR